MERADLEYGNAVEDCWKLVDAEIGDLLEMVNENSHIFVFSDHEATALKRVLGLNVWLTLNGYLSLKRVPLRRRMLNVIKRWSAFFKRRRKDDRGKVERPRLCVDERINRTAKRVIMSKI